MEYEREHERIVLEHTRLDYNARYSGKGKKYFWKQKEMIAKLGFDPRSSRLLV
jgi:hypothetical protein